MVHNVEEYKLNTFFSFSISGFSLKDYQILFLTVLTIKTEQLIKLIKTIFSSY